MIFFPWGFLAMTDYFARKIHEAAQVLGQDKEKSSKKVKIGDILFSLLIISLFAATLPHPLINIASSFLALSMALALAVYRRFSSEFFFTRAKKRLLILTILCQLAGCAQIAQETKPPDMRLLDPPPSRSFKVAGAWSIILCGIDFNPATINDIISQRRISRPLYIIDWRSYGLLGLRKIIVVGV